MPHLSIHTFGSFYVTLDGEPVTTFESDKVRALLVYLAAGAGRPHSRDSLIGFLWPDQPERAARRNLSQALFNLRQAIRDDDASPALVCITRDAIQINPDGDFWLDSAAFSTCVERNREHSHGDRRLCEACVNRLIEMDALYRGEFLAGFFVNDSNPFGEWAMLCRERFHREVLVAQAHLAHHFERRRDYERALHYARRQVELEMWREEAHRQLMRLLARSGQRSAALAQYEVCRSTLAREMGIDPDEETQALYTRIRAASAARPHKIPVQPAPLIGREEELANIALRLDDPECRLVTLVGPGGIGKTRLALQAAAEAECFFLHGACLIPVGPVSSTEYLPSAVANALGLQFHGTRPPAEQLATYLQEKELLLVMDGFEHLLPGALLVASILDSSPHVKILVTSRERLNLQAEWLLDVPGLACPAPDSPEEAAAYSAVQLFLQRARQIQPAFALSEANQTHIVRICHAVEGTPLGIQLASGWVRTLSCEQIADQVQGDLDFLTTTLRDVPAQHQSQRAVFQRSWALLSESEQEALARLVAFREPFTHQAAQAVAGAASATLSSLVEKSLLSHNLPEQYDLHLLVKQYAAEALAARAGEPQRTHDLHCRYYMQFLYARERALKGARQPEARAEIRMVVGDVRAAWQWAVTRLHLDLLSLALDGLYLFYRVQGQFVEGRELLRLAADAIRTLDGAANLLRLRIGTRLADFSSSLGEHDLARPMLETSLDGLQVEEQPNELAFALAALGRMHYRLGEFIPARSHLKASVIAYRATEDRWGLAQALNDLANVLVSDLDEYDHARLCYEESLSLSKEIGDRSGVARALLNIGAIEHMLHHSLEAESLYEQSAAISREIGDRRNLAIALSNLGNLAYRQQAYERATALVRESLDIKQESGDRYSILFSVMSLGNIACKTGQIQEARQWFDHVLRLATAMGSAYLSACGLVCVARLCMAIGDLPQAVEMLQLALNYAGTDGELIEEINGLLADLEKQLSQETMAASRHRGDARQLEDVIEDLLTHGLPGMLKLG